MNTFTNFSELYAANSDVSNMAVGNMSPTKGAVAGYTIQVPVNDHYPPHVTIKRGGDTVGKIPIDPKDRNALSYDVSHIPQGDLKKIEKHINDNKGKYMNAWRGIHPAQEQ